MPAALDGDVDVVRGGVLEGDGDLVGGGGHEAEARGFGCGGGPAGDGGGVGRAGGGGEEGAGGEEGSEGLDLGGGEFRAGGWGWLGDGAHGGWLVGWGLCRVGWRDESRNDGFDEIWISLQDGETIKERGWPCRWNRCNDAPREYAKEDSLPQGITFTLTSVARDFEQLQRRATLSDLNASEIEERQDGVSPPRAGVGMVRWVVSMAPNDRDLSSEWRWQGSAGEIHDIVGEHVALPKTESAMWF